jgi:AAHS family 4-hydroxybenzoate transporter-like MFS transporter
MQRQTIDVTHVVDDATVSGFNIKLMIWSFLVLVIDGYDASAAGFAGPALVKAWNITNMAQLGTVFSASVAGVMVGAVALGYLGDRLGRKTTLIISTFIFAILTLAAAAASSLQELMFLRFFAGIGLGGVYPLVIVLNTEYAPKRVRATLVTIMFLGAIVGAGIPGPIAAWVIPTYGWQAMFIIGGLIPLVIGLALIFVLPESLKFLALKPHRRAELIKYLALVRPDLRIPADAQFIISGEQRGESLSLRQLFTHGLGTSTVLLWILFSIGGMTFYFMQAWMPTILTTSGVPIQKAAIAVAFYQLGGVVGGLAISRPIDLFGIWPVTLLYLVAIPAALLIGMPGHSETLVMSLLFISGICLLGGQLGLNTAAGLVYPTYIRANGVGWAFGVGRIGSVAALTMAGVLIGMHLPLQQLFAIVAGLLAIGVVASVFFGLRNNRKLVAGVVAPVATPASDPLVGR